MLTELLAAQNEALIAEAERLAGQVAALREALEKAGGDLIGFHGYFERGGSMGTALSIQRTLDVIDAALAAAGQEARGVTDGYQLVVEIADCLGLMRRGGLVRERLVLHPEAHLLLLKTEGVHRQQTADGALAFFGLPTTEDASEPWWRIVLRNGLSVNREVYLALRGRQP